MGLTGTIDDFTFDIFDFDASKVAEATDKIAEILNASARENIALQREQLEEVEQRTEPFRAITETALPTLSALATGGEVDYTPSELFKRRLEQGRGDVLTSRAGGSLKSSGTSESLADLVSGLAAEDVGRYEQGQLDLLRAGLRAEDVLRGAEAGAGSRISGALGNLGQQLNANQQALAQAQQAGKSTLIHGGLSLATLPFIL